MRWLDSALDKWKLEQAAPDGTVELAPPVPGLLTVKLGDLANPRPRRVPVADLRPEQCAGPGVRCAFDLLMRLYAEQYPGIKPASDKLPIKLLAALLVRRDYRTMPLSSLAFAAGMFHTMDEIDLRYFAREAGTLNAQEATRDKQLADARKRAVVRKAEIKRERENKVESLGVEYFQANPNAGNEDAAKYIHAIVCAWEHFGHASVPSIERMLAGTKKRALALLARNTR